jgi:hypothetical protein
MSYLPLPVTKIVNKSSNFNKYKYNYWVGWVALVELRIEELEVQGSSPGKEKI